MNQRSWMLSSKELLSKWELLRVTRLVSEMHRQFPPWVLWSTRYYNEDDLCSTAIYVCALGFTLFKLCLLQTIIYAPTLLCNQRSSLNIYLALGQRANGPGVPLSSFRPISFSSASSVDVSLLLALLLICYNGM